MTSKELLDNILAEEQLLARGYKKEPCKSCKGIGHLRSADRSGDCSTCGGKGWNWLAPITK